jgi:hypothetical protein
MTLRRCNPRKTVAGIRRCDHGNKTVGWGEIPGVTASFTSRFPSMSAKALTDFDDRWKLYTQVHGDLEGAAKAMSTGSSRCLLSILGALRCTRRILTPKEKPC